MRNNRGFTLMEIMLVVIIIGILAAIVVPNLAGRSEEARQKAALAQIVNFGVALDLFELDMGDYPDKLDDLVKKPSSGKNWKGPYLKNMDSVPDDPWGEKYNYQVDKDTSNYSLFSVGKDGRANTNDDIKPGKSSESDSK
jgi:general secretion pathway protein G